MLKATTKKWLFAGLLALAGATADASVQLASGTFEPTRSAILGLGLGIFSRVLGAVLAILPTTDADL